MSLSATSVVPCCSTTTSLPSDFGLQQIEEIVRRGIAVDFNQGLDARRACDDPYILDLLCPCQVDTGIYASRAILKEQLSSVIRCVDRLEYRGVNRHRFFVYCLIKDDIQDALYRLNTLRRLNINPFAQPYRDFDNKVEPTKEQKRIANWCNKKAVFYSCEFKNFR